MLISTSTAHILASRTKASTLEDMLRRDIITGVLLPSGKLRIKELGERYAAGAIPLREALSRLCATGFVVAVDQKGFRVADVSLAELADITETRQQIERLAIVKAIRRRDPKWEGDVLSVHHQLQRISVYTAGDSSRLSPDWERVHDRFHEVLIAGCQSEWLMHFASMLRDQTARYRHLSTTAPHAQDRNLALEHEAIVQAVLSHDVELASTLLVEHFAKTTQLVTAALHSMLEARSNT
jgi:GntR family carbon starvation induced transcriptional regulator